MIIFSKLIKIIIHPWFCLAWLGLALLSYYFIDLPLAVYIYYPHTNYLNQLEQIASMIGISGNYYLAIFAALFLLYRFVIFKEKTLPIAVFILISTAIGSAICDIAKVILGRSRPIEFIHHQLYGFHFWQFNSNMWSFPSGHAAFSTSLMMGLSLFYPRFWPLFFAAFLTVSISRIFSDAHYLSDIMMGMYLGATVIILLYNRLLRNGHWIIMSQTKRH